MKTKYDFVYLTNTPSFYKLNLCNEICKKGKSLLLILYGYGSEAVNIVLNDNNKWLFDFKFINEGDANKRNKFLTFINLVKLLSNIQYKKLLFAGWLAPEYNLLSFFVPKSKNAMICESSILDVSFKGITGKIKKTIINRMNSVLPSGTPHKELFESIGFKGNIHITGSVGIFNKPPHDNRITNSPLKYLYVGRLVDVKNISMLIDEFNRNGKSLTIVGSGNLEKELKAIAKFNITFKGFINNEDLGAVYQAHDVFILPSYYEPWGLVVEEALYWGLPVIVSDRVGSGIDMVRNLGTGLIFASKNIDSLNQCINDMENNYIKFVSKVKAIDWGARDRKQVNAYLID